MSTNFQNWAEKYRVEKFEEVKGQNAAITEVKNFFSYFPNDKKAVLLYGPAGTGKTSLAHVLKKEFDLEIFELNASDFRNKEQLDAKLKPASEQKSLFKKGKVILVDEVDGLSSRKDRGGLPELISLIDGSQFPVIVTANNIWDKNFNDLRKKCKLVNLKELNYNDIALILEEIAKKEKLQIDKQILISIAVRAKGDVRAAINDLQTLASDKDSLSNYLNIADRNKATDIFNALKYVFKEMIREDTLRIYDSVDMPLEKIFLWVEENIPNEYNNEELYKAYEALSIADVFRGRIMRQRHWRFLIYQNIFLSAGISLAKSKPKTGFTHYQKPTRVLKIWMNNIKAKHKQTIIAKYANKVHCSKKKAYKEFGVARHFLKNPAIQKELKLSEKEIEYVMSR